MRQCQFCNWNSQFYFAFNAATGHIKGLTLIRTRKVEVSSHFFPSEITLGAALFPIENVRKGAGFQKTLPVALMETEASQHQIIALFKNLGDLITRLQACCLV